MTDARATQLGRLTLGVGDPAARATQELRLTVGVGNPRGRVTQAARLTIGGNAFDLRATQVVRLTVATGVDCVTHWCQCWILERRDGVVFRFTSLDVDFAWGGEIYKSCSSLSPSANEEASDIGSVSNMELAGILSDDGIKEDELYGGLFDDAFCEVWLVPYQGTESPRRLAAGWVGDVSHGEQGFKAEVVGPGARLDQNAIVQLYSANCRWVFGSAQCTKDLSLLQTSGEVISSGSRGVFESTAEDPDNDSQWANGRVIWQTGRNAGMTCEVKSVDFGSVAKSGESDGDASSGTPATTIVLWAQTAFVPEPGDTFILQPGCDLSPTACKGYGNYLNFGGFDKVPGQDAIAQTPDAKIDS